MGKKAKAKRESGKVAKVEGPSLRPAPNWPLLALSGLGILLTGYLTWTTWSGASVRGCGVGSGCDVVLTSKWGMLFGLPTSFWGLSAYVALALTSFIRRADRHWTAAWNIALFGVLYSLYLTTVSLTVLDAACPYCLTSLALMTSILVLTTYQRPAQMANFSWPRRLTRTVPAGLALVLILHLHYSGVLGEAPPAEDASARALADHLSQTGAKFYGAAWCPHCQEQKAIFGRSANRLPYIECSPGGRSAPQAEECRTAGIVSYPTWFINGERIQDVLSLKKLADSSGFKGPLSSN